MRQFSEAEVAAFERDGFLVVPGLFGPAETAELQAWTDEVQAYPEIPGRHMVYGEMSL